MRKIKKDSWKEKIDPNFDELIMKKGSPIRRLAVKDKPPPIAKIIFFYVVESINRTCQFL